MCTCVYVSVLVCVLVFALGVRDSVWGGAVITDIRKVPSTQAEPWLQSPHWVLAACTDHQGGTLTVSLLGRAGRSLWVDLCQVSWLALPPSGHPRRPRTWGWSGQRAGRPSPRVATAIHSSPLGRVHQPHGPLQENGSSSGVRRLDDQDGARHSHQPSRGGPSSLSPLQSSVVQSASSSLVALPRSHPCPNLGCPSGLSQVGVLASQMSYEFETLRTDHRGLRPAVGIWPPSPMGRALKAHLGLGCASSLTVAMGRDSSTSPLQPFV